MQLSHYPHHLIRLRVWHVGFRVEGTKINGAGISMFIIIIIRALKIALLVYGLLKFTSEHHSNHITVRGERVAALPRCSPYRSFLFHLPFFDDQNFESLA
jgi:hypothetical protein